MSGNDPFTGWDGDAKGQPMVLVSPDSGSGGGGSRITLVLLIAALVISLGIAAYSMLRVDNVNRANLAAVAETTKKHTAEVKTLEEKLVRATIARKDDLDYVAALEADNAALKNRQRPTPYPPRPPELQKYIDDLQLENAQRRTPGKAVVVATRPAGYDAYRANP